MLKGSCLCGDIRFEIHCQPKAVSHCHCKMCQKQHGAAFATYISVPKDKLNYFSAEEKLSVYRSSSGVTRKFCKTCGSNIEWCGSVEFPEWVSIALASIDTVFNTGSIKHIHLESKACWVADTVCE